MKVLVSMVLAGTYMTAPNTMGKFSICNCEDMHVYVQIFMQSSR